MSRYGAMAASMKGTGRTIKQMVEGDSYTLMETSIWEIGSKTRPKDRASTSTLTGLFMMECG